MRLLIRGDVPAAADGAAGGSADGTASPVRIVVRQGKCLWECDRAVGSFRVQAWLEAALKEA